MRYEAIITNVDFKAMVNGTPSVLQLSVSIPARQITDQLLSEEVDSIENICSKYKFKLVSPNTYDFGDIVGKHCVAEGNGRQYTFIRFVTAVN